MEEIIRNEGTYLECFSLDGYSAAVHGTPIIVVRIYEIPHFAFKYHNTNSPPKPREINNSD